ncbi:MAG: TolC family protein [Terriglobales bacterium]|nr:TolC family protein [Terriglobales bacterium]
MVDFHAIPVRDDRLSASYVVVGVNIQIPIFNGFLFNARTREAELRSQAAKQQILDLRKRISRDVRTSWLNARTSYERVAGSRQLLDQANQALDLAQTRYNLGLGSIVELSQGQLQQTQAEIGSAQKFSVGQNFTYNGCKFDHSVVNLCREGSTR